MKKRLFVAVAALLLTIPAACMYPHYGPPGGGPGGPGCPKHMNCDCKCRQGQDAPRPNCPNCPQSQQPSK